MLSAQGCGDNFMRAIGCSMEETLNAISSETFKTTSGVKQSSSTSCALFTFYLDYTIRAVRTFGEDGFLHQDHLLLLMDDTVLLATSREAMEEKLSILYNSSQDIDMVIHHNKSQFMVVDS